MSYSMESILIYIAITIVIIISFIFGEVLPIVLPRLNRFFDHKPFNCRPCFTFHLHWMGMAFVAVMFQSWIIALSGIVTAFIVFGIVKYLDSKKIIE